MQKLKVTHPDSVSYRRKIPKTTETDSVTDFLMGDKITHAGESTQKTINDKSLKYFYIKLCVTEKVYNRLYLPQSIFCIINLL